MNRSCAAHKRLVDAGYVNCKSYGTGKKVRLPGPSVDRPNVYDFGTPYATILDDLIRKDEHLYKRNGIIKLLRRNLAIKDAPERFQSENSVEFDLIICYETRVYDAVVDHFLSRPSTSMHPVHVVGAPV